jgi:subtilisin family serine protease
MGLHQIVRRRIVLAALAGAALLGGFHLVSRPVSAQSADRVNVLITFASQPGPADDALVRAAGGQVRRTFHLVPGMAATLPAAAVTALQNNPRIAAIEPDGRVEAYDAELDLTWGVARIGSGTVHAAGITGAGVRVAVFDSGIEYTHYELSHAYAGGYDFVNDDADPIDDNGHGTHVSGTIAAADDESWVVGVAPGVQLFGVKMLDATGNGDFSHVIAGLEWAVDNGIQIANHSYGSSADPGTLFQQAFVNSAAAGVLHVAAAGNTGNCRGTGNSVGYPARYDVVIAVAASDQSDARTCTSSTGPAVELTAPGDWIPSSYLYGDIAAGSGTSMAAPHVTGAAALLRSTGVSSAAAIRQLLTSTAEDLGDPGRDKLYGFGLVNVAAAVAAAGPVAPAVQVALSTDKALYSETDTTAALTVAVTDQTGAAIGGLGAGSFVTSLGTGVVGVTFVETATPGLYTATFDISTLGAGSYALTVQVSSGALAGSDTAGFVIGTPPQPGTVRVSSITYALSGNGRGGKRTLTITATVVDGNDAPVANATVSVIVYVNGTPWAFGESPTNTQGQAVFGSTTAPDGTYYTQVYGVVAGALTWDGQTPPNTSTK